MLTIPSWLLVLAEQTIIVLLVLVVFFYLRSRKYKRIVRRQEQGLDQNDHGQHATVTKQILAPPDLKDLGVIKERLALSEQRVKNLERFRELFFDLKDRVATLMEHQQQMNQHMLEAGLPLEEQKALMAAFDKLKKEKEVLEQHLQQVEDELDILMVTPDVDSLKAKESPSAAHVIHDQQAKIGKLIQEIADLEVEAATGHRIQTTINQLNEQSDELSIAIEVLQDENQFLNEQVQTLLQQQNPQGDQVNKEIDLLTSQLAEKQHAYDELYKKHVRLEQEYLKSKT
jgi:DNA repair exonuclease SbcCD ATPase subunit